MKWRWKYFTPEEVLSPDGLDQLARGNFLIQPSALDYLEALRANVGVPFLINHGNLKYRGYRSSSENSKIGGAEFSRHVQGIAFDVTPAQGSLTGLFKAALRFNVFGGIGLYLSNNFVHIDTRPTINDTPVIWGNK